jgi:hypothetical protein
MQHAPDPVPLIDQVEIRSVFSFLDGHGVLTGDLLAQAYLPAPTSERKSRVVSARSLLRFLSLAAREVELLMNSAISMAAEAVQRRIQAFTQPLRSRSGAMHCKRTTPVGCSAAES